MIETAQMEINDVQMVEKGVGAGAADCNVEEDMDPPARHTLPAMAPNVGVGVFLTQVLRQMGARQNGGSEGHGMHLQDGGDASSKPEDSEILEMRTGPPFLLRWRAEWRGKVGKLACCSLEKGVVRSREGGYSLVNGGGYGI